MSWSSNNQWWCSHRSFNERCETEARRVKRGSRWVSSGRKGGYGRVVCGSGSAPSGRTYGRRPFSLGGRRVRCGRTPALPKKHRDDVAGGAREEHSFPDTPALPKDTGTVWRAVPGKTTAPFGKCTRWGETGAGRVTLYWIILPECGNAKFSGNMFCDSL
jgi:hypothetical protein